MDHARLLVVAPLVLVAPAQGDRESFEDFLERARLQRDQQQARLSSQVRDAVAKLAASERGSRNDADKALAELVALGPEAAPLILPYLDPGAGASDLDRSRALRCATALAKLDTTSVTDALIAMVKGGTDDGKRNALRVLEATRDQALVQPKLAELFQNTEGPLKQALLRTMFAIGGADNTALVRDVLLGGDVELQRLAFGAMTEGKIDDLADAVDQLLARPKQVAPVMREALGYFRAVPAAVRESAVRQLIALAGNSTDLTVEDRQDILGALASFDLKLNTELRKGLDGLTQSRDRRIREGALVALACLGDKSTRKELLAEYDDRVRKNDRWGPAFADRAAILYRIRDYDAAAKDYLQALQAFKQDPTPHPELYVGLARCYAMLGRFKDSSDWLEKAPIGFDELRRLADEPTFAKLKEHPKYGQILRGF